MPPKTIATFGASRQKVRVFVQGDLVRVRYRNPGRKTRSWPNTAENRAYAKAFAKAIVEGREARTTAAPATLRQLWEKFAEAEFPHLRPKSKKLYKEYFARWETMWGRDFIAERTTLLMVVEFRTALAKQGKAISTIRHSVETVKMVYAWGAMHKLIPTSEIALYKFKVAKEARKAPPPEYTDDEYRKILAKLDPSKGSQWRPWVALTICREQGVRQTSVLHLKWDDIDFDEATITWRAPWDKMGREWTQPMRSGTARALTIAALPRTNSNYVLPSGSRKNKGSCYTIGALYLALRGAEERAGIKHLPQRGAHGLRRLLAGDINEATGDPALAMMAIGDDVRQAGRYIQKRDDRMAEAFAQLDAEKQP